MKYEKTIQLTEQQRRDINKKLSYYAPNGGLGEEFKIKEDTILDTFNTEFENGFKFYIALKSGQNNCWLEYVLVDALGFERHTYLIEDEICYSDGTDAMKGGDNIVIKEGEDTYEITIAPKTKEDVIEFHKHIKEELSEFDYKQYKEYSKYGAVSITVTGDIVDIEKAKALLKDSNLELQINE